MCGGFHKWGVPKMMVYNGKSQPKMDDLGVPPFMETPICVFLFFSQVVLQQGDLLGIMQHVLHKTSWCQTTISWSPKNFPAKIVWRLSHFQAWGILAVKQPFVCAKLSP